MLLATKNILILKTLTVGPGKPESEFSFIHSFCIYAISSTAGKDARMLECPIYRKPARTERNYIGSIHFQTDIGQNHLFMVWRYYVDRDIRMDNITVINVFRLGKEKNR